MTDDMYANHRDRQGRFTTGNPGGGRPRSKELVSLLNEEFPPEEMVSMIRQTWDKAVQTGSPRTMLQVLETLLAYQIGRPAAKLDVTQSNSMDWLIEHINQGPTLNEMFAQIGFTGSTTALPGPDDA